MDREMQTPVDSLKTASLGETAHKAANASIMDKVMERVDANRKELESKFPAVLKGPYVGQIVHYRLPDGPQEGETRGAVIVKFHDDDALMVSLHIFLDPESDGVYEADVRQIQQGPGYHQWKSVEEFELPVADGYPV